MVGTVTCNNAVLGNGVIGEYTNWPSGSDSPACPGQGRDGRITAVEPDPVRGGPAERPQGQLRRSAGIGHDGRTRLSGGADSRPAAPGRLRLVVPCQLEADRGVP